VAPRPGSDQVTDSRLQHQDGLVGHEGVAVHLSEFGAGAGSPIVLLHEGLGSTSAWGSFPALLAQRTRRRVVVYDRRGYGRSGPWPGPWPASFLEDEAAEALGPLLVGLGHPAPVLVGHSDGASIALAYPAVRHHDWPEPLGIVSLSAHVLVEDCSVAAITALAGQRDELVPRLARHHQDAGALFDAWTEVWTSRRFRTWTLDGSLAALRCPVLAVQGADDRYGTRLQLERLAAAAGGPVEVHELSGVDHWPHREATEAVLGLIDSFCRRLDP
jgi:pimeloyl-ACP methyl ester carboxylesterase